MTVRNDFNYGLEIEGTYSITQEGGAVYINSNMLGTGLTFSGNSLSVSGSFSSYQEVTISDLNTILIPGDLLTPGVLYKIDTGETTYKDNGIFLQAISINQLSKVGTRLFLAPSTYEIISIGGNNWLGVWQSTLTPSIGDLVIWGGLAWSNVNGLIGAPVDDFTLDAEWSVIQKDSFINGEYIEMIMNCKFDYENNWIEKQIDSNNNEIGISFEENNTIYALTINPCDYSDWNYNQPIAPVFLSNNLKLGFYNNIGSNVISNKANRIYNNIISGNITNNIIFGDIYNNTNFGDIAFNKTLSIYDNSNQSNINLNSNLGEIYNNSNNGEIELNSNLGSISDNSNDGHISANGNLGNINLNSNDGNIEQNYNSGGINSNDNNISNIEFNINNGHIDNNTGVAGPWNIEYNTNNGFISTTALANITDSIVNK